MGDCTCPNGGHTNALGTWHVPGCPATAAEIDLENLRADRDRYRKALEDIRDRHCCDDACNRPCACERAAAALKAQ